MIEILNKIDVEKIKDENVREYLEYSFNRLPSDFQYPDFGYFVIVENFNELIVKSIELYCYSISGLNNGLYDDINLVEIRNEIIEILVFVDNDISVSLILPMNILPLKYKDKLKEYVI